MEWTTKDIVFMVLGSGTFIGALVVVFNAVAARLDARKKRHEDAELRKISNAIEVKRLQADTDEKASSSLVANLWKIIDTKNGEITKLEGEVEECEKTAKLSRPVINQVYAKLRAMRKEIEKDADLNVLRTLVEETEGLLP